MKDRLTTALLAIFFGQLGVHRFYLGQIGYGFLYLFATFIVIPIIFFRIFFLFPFFLILALPLIDFIIIITMSDKEFDVKYNKGNPSKAYPKNTQTVTEEIETLHDLKLRGLITEEEFSQRKAKIL